MRKLSEMILQLDEVITHYENEDADAAAFLRADLYREARGLDPDDRAAFGSYNELVIAADAALERKYWEQSAGNSAQPLEL